MLKKPKFQFRHWDRVHRHGGYLSFYWCICFGFWGWYWWVGHFRSRRGNRHSGGAIFCNYRSPRCSAYKWYKTKLQRYLINFLVHFWKGYLFLRFISRFVYSKVPYKRSSIPNLPSWPIRERTFGFSFSSINLVLNTKIHSVFVLPIGTISPITIIIWLLGWSIFQEIPFPFNMILFNTGLYILCIQ